MNTPKNLLYSKYHAWVKIKKGNTAIVGITDELQDMLESIDDIELPVENDELEMDLECTTIHYGGEMYDLPSPLTGRVIKVNNDLKKNLHLLHSSCYSKGWLFEMEYDEPEELEMLFDADQYIYMSETGDSGESEEESTEF